VTSGPVSLLVNSPCFHLSEFTALLTSVLANFLVSNQEITSYGCSHINNIIYCPQNAIICITKVEEAFKCENRSKPVIEDTIQFLSFDELLDDTDATEDADENRLLPAMNKLWPYMIICLRNKISVVWFLTPNCFLLLYKWPSYSLTLCT
jgi:hypothetical protein